MSEHQANLAAMCIGVAALTVLEGCDNRKEAAAILQRLAKEAARMIADGTLNPKPSN